MESNTDGRVTSLSMLWNIIVCSPPGRCQNPCPRSYKTRDRLSPCASQKKQPLGDSASTGRSCGYQLLEFLQNLVVQRLLNPVQGSGRSGAIQDAMIALQRYQAPATLLDGTKGQTAGHHARVQSIGHSLPGQGTDATSPNAPGSILVIDVHTPPPCQSTNPLRQHGRPPLGSKGSRRFRSLKTI